MCACGALQPFQDRALLFLSAGLLKRHIPRSELKPPREAPAATHNDPINFVALPHVLRKSSIAEHSVCVCTCGPAWYVRSLNSEPLDPLSLQGNAWALDAVTLGASHVSSDWCM
jgi:hypothetical protein